MAKVVLIKLLLKACLWLVDFRASVSLSLCVKRLAPGIQRQRENKQQWFLSSTSFSGDRGAEADSKGRTHGDKNTK